MKVSSTPTSGRHPLHPLRKPARVLDDLPGLLVGLQAPPARRQGGGRHEDHQRAVHAHTGGRVGQEQINVGREAQRPVWGGGWQEDDMAGDRRRLGSGVHHVAPWQIGWVVFNAPARLPALGWRPGLMSHGVYTGRDGASAEEPAIR
jgi:hypothetical protein